MTWFATMLEQTKWSDEVFPALEQNNFNITKRNNKTVYDP
jgi:hypothetical protein